MWCHRCVAGLGPTPVGKVCGCWCWQGHYLCPLCSSGFLPARRLGSRSDCLKRLQVETALPCKSCGLPPQPQAQPDAQGGVQNPPLEGRRVSITPGERAAGLHSVAPLQARPGAAPSGGLLCALHSSYGALLAWMGCHLLLMSTGSSTRSVRLSRNVVCLLFPTLTVFTQGTVSPLPVLPLPPPQPAGGPGLWRRK